MDRIQLKLAVLAFAAILLFGASHPADAASIGISPAELSFGNVLRGGYAESSVSVSTSSATPLNFTIGAQGAVSGWVEFVPSMNMTVSAGEMKRVAVIIRPPADVANGNYTGNIIVSTTSARSGGSGAGVGVTTGSTSDLSVSITGEEIKNATVESMGVSDTEEGSPAELQVSVLNRGNVIATPLITADISKKGSAAVLKSASHGDTGVLPTKMGIIRLKLAAEDLEVGDYDVKVRVSIGGENIAESGLGFRVLERGSLSKKGVLQKLWNPPWADIGTVVKIDAYFENQGELLVSGKFRGEIYRASALVEVVESDELEIPVGKTVMLSAYFKPQLPGQFVVRGSVIYGGKTTELKESFINVGPASGQAPPADVAYIAAAALAIIVAVGFVLFRRFKKGKLKRGK
jgi:hypothetical protein